MTGSRIRLARLANGLSLQQLTDRMKIRGISFTKTALFNYEADTTVPNEQLLSLFAEALGVNTRFFLSDSPGDLKITLKNDLKAVEARQQEVLAYIQLQLEYLISLINLAEEPLSGPDLPSPIKAENIQDAKIAAEQLREKWDISKMSVSSVCSLLEHNGWVIFELPEFFKWDYISGEEETHHIHFIFFSRNTSLDELRMGLLRELGRHLLICDKAKENELLTVFAGNVLLSDEAIWNDIGKTRSAVHDEELRCMKQKYGLSRLEILRRLYHSGVIDHQTYQRTTDHMQQTYYISRSYQHVVPLHFFEEVTRMNLLVRRLLAEGKISGEEDLYYSTL